MSNTETQEGIGSYKIAPAVAAGALVAACGGGGSTPSQPNSGGSAAANTSNAPPNSMQEAARFLAQATNGTDFGEIERASRAGLEGWLNGQLSTPRSGTYWGWLEENGFADEGRLFALADWEIGLWYKLLHDRDLLRQRMTLALLDILVVGIGSLHPGWRSFSMANYFDVLADHSFGNFRDLIEAVTYSTAMGDWLTYIGSRKANSKGSMPDENYARELMQLFTLGLHQLYDDGSPKLGSDGAPLPTYTQSDVTELSRVFTGIVPSDPDFNNRNRNRERLVIDAAYNDEGEKVVLGQRISVGGHDAIKQSLDIIFAHENLPPFFSRQLILRLVSSNPSAAYVQRVAKVFADNGQGERGDLGAVLKAILLDQEARNPPAASAGKLREPAQRLLNWARAFGVRPSADKLAGPYLHGSLLKSPGWSPTVFNFFDADYSPPLSEIRSKGLSAPGFQIASEQTAVEYISFIDNAIQGNWASRGLDPKFDDYIELGKDAVSLVERLNIVLAAGQLSPAIVGEIVSQADAIPAADDAGIVRRTKFVALMILASPDYLVLT